MLSFELCKQLKALGFSQENKDYYFNEDGTRTPTPLQASNDCLTSFNVCCPTLSELIEACGEKIFGLQKRGTQGDAKAPWVAFPNTPPWENMNYGEGETPEEAVANLWLALNEKPHEEKS